MHSPCTVKACQEKTVYILACSPRVGGNTDMMAQQAAQGVRQAGGEAQILFLRDYTIQPCIGCGVCFSHPQHACIFENKDHAAQLFALLEGDAPLVLLSPIYFYHVPAHLKAFMDRAQKYWAKNATAQEAQGLSPSSIKKSWEKKVTVGLVAARQRGDNLFTGTLLSLGLFFDVFHRSIQGKSLWMGYDGPQDFAQDTEACMQMQSVGAQLASCVHGIIEG